MPKQSPVPDEIDKPFWDACNQDRLVLQHCDACDRFQHPPEHSCAECGMSGSLSWREIGGSGTIYSYAVIYDTPIGLLQEDQPYTAAVIDLDDAPGINMISHLPGIPVDAIPIGASVRLVFEKTQATGQKVPEWQICS
jgi:uncharacterized OB-fold protein